MNEKEIYRIRAIEKMNLALRWDERIAKKDAKNWGALAERTFEFYAQQAAIEAERCFRLSREKR